MDIISSVRAGRIVALPVTVLTAGASACGNVRAANATVHTVDHALWPKS